MATDAEAGIAVNETVIHPYEYSHTRMIASLRHSFPEDSVQKIALIFLMTSCVNSENYLKRDLDLFFYFK